MTTQLKTNDLLQSPIEMESQMACPRATLIKGILLIAGTSIGGGMLALPVLTSLAGFFPSLLIYLFCWLFMAATGLLLLEASLWMDHESNLVTMAERTLGVWGKIAAWALYLFLFYCLTVAYIVGCGNLLAEIFGITQLDWLGSLLFVVCVFPLIFIGAKVIGPLNAIFMVGLAVSYFAFVVLGFPHINFSLLNHSDWSYTLMALPIAFTAFAYQGIVPTLVTYMHRDVKKLKWAILIGSSMPLIVYAIWQGLILGIIPTYGTGGLAEALKKGENAVQPLKHFLNDPKVVIIGQVFAFCALITSFFGVSLGLTDFLSDGLKIKKTPLGKSILCALVLGPPMILAFTYPGIFLSALDFAGGFGCALLLGLLPVLMVWSGRYYRGFSSEQILPGGKASLVILILFVVLEVGIQLAIINKQLLK